MFPPAYSEYLKEIKLLGGEVELFELMEDKDYMLDVDTLISHITKDTDLVVICNPNNPTGTYVTIDQTEKNSQALYGLWCSSYDGRNIC